MKKLILTNILVALSAVCGGLCSSCTSKMENAIETKFPSEDWVISDYVVTDPVFGAKAEPGFDNREAFQAAIDSAYNNGGGVVYVPAGCYEFHSEAIGKKTVRVRHGDDENIKEYSYKYVLKLPAGVQLRGDWADPVKNDGKVDGTILEVYAGINFPNANAMIESWWNDPQAGNKLHTSFTSIADRFIEMAEGTAVRNLSIWYPEQSINDVKVYPWTLFQTHGDCATVQNVTLVNSYYGFYSAPSELHYVHNSYLTALNRGLEIHVCTDIGRIENVFISPEIWAKSGLPGSPSIEDISSYTRKNSIGFKMHRSDWEYVSGLSVHDYNIGLWIGKEPGFPDAPNSQLYGLDVSGCENGMLVEDVNPYGLLISNSNLGSNESGNAVYFSKDFHTVVQFNGVNFDGRILSDSNNGLVSFESCKFSELSDYALQINSGNLLLTQCNFMQASGYVSLGKLANVVKSVNSGKDNKLDVKKVSNRTQVQISVDDKYAFTSIPQNVVTDIKVRPKPQSAKVFKAVLPKAMGFNNDVPSEDVSSLLQDILNEVKNNGGGTVYLPAGRYLIESPIVVPSGVELRGSWDVQHHTQSGGTALFTNYDGGEKGELGESLIQLDENAGLNGLTIAQLNIVSDGYDIENPRKTPFLIQGKGPKVYVINVTVSLGDKGIDLASYDTSGHYVDYFAGVLLRAGIWAGGGSVGGFIRNMQFNPHYGARLPKGKQGYPEAVMTKFVQSHCSALKFSDVKQQTIFNNFVYGSVYGIHFLKDAITGNYPGQITMIGHGSDGCTYSLFVEDADENTKIVAINSELVNTNIIHEPVRSYVLMGDEPGTLKVHPNAELVLYNSAFWGSPVLASIVNNGKVRIQQGNFTRCGKAGIDVRGGEVSVYTTCFAQPLSNGNYVSLSNDECNAELTNNYYASELKVDSKDIARVVGIDIEAK